MQVRLANAIRPTRANPAGSMWVAKDGTLWRRGPHGDAGDNFNWQRLDGQEMGPNGFLRPSWVWRRSDHDPDWIPFKV